MMVKNIDKFIQSLEDIFEVNIEENKEIPFEEREIKFLDLYLDEFWQYLQNNWQELDNYAINFYNSYLNYQSKKSNWKLILKDSENLSVIDFVLKHSQISSAFEQSIKDNKLKEKDIEYEKLNILKKSPRILSNEDLTKFQKFNLYSFEFFENGPLKINLHLRLNKSINFNFLILINLTVNYPSANQEFSMEFINEYYHSFIIMYELINYLSELGYNEVDQEYASREVYISDDLKYGNIINNYYNIVQNEITFDPFSNSSPEKRIFPPIEFKAFYLNLLHNSAHELFSFLANNLKEIKIIIERYSNILNPKSYYDAFENELKDFLVKGKDLFLKAEDILYEKLTPEKKIEYKIPKKKKLTLDKVYSLFLKEYNKDIKNGIEDDDAGFRSKKEFFDKYQKQLKVSQGTFYNKFDKIATKINNFEKRERLKPGGGEEFRIIPPEREINYIKIKKDITQISLATNDYTKESYDVMLEYEEAMFYYTDRQFDVAKKILKKIYSSYPEPLKDQSIIYSQILYYLGEIYFKMWNLDKALIIFSEGNEIESKSERNLFKFNVEMLKIQRCKGDYSDLSERVYELEKKIQTAYKIRLNKINEEFKFIDDLRIEDLDIYHISQLKKNPNFRKNQTFIEIIILELNQLKLNFLKLDLIRKEILIELNENPIKEIEQYGKVVKKIPNKIQILLDNAYDIIELSSRIKFNREHNFLLSFDLFKQYFDSIKESETSPFFTGEYYVDFEQIFPLFYFKFLKAIVNAESYHQNPEYLEKYEINRLDLESRMEYYIKISKSKLKRPGFSIKTGNLINLYINLNTLMDYTIILGENSKSKYLVNLAKNIRKKAIEKRDTLEKAMKQSRERE